jgi:Flp pilus assembly protein TadG
MSRYSPLRTPRPRQLLSESGQGLVEFAIVLPLLCVLILAIVQFGVLWNNYITLTDATRAGARVAAVSRTAGDPIGATKAAVCNSAYNMDCTTLNPQVSPGTPWSSGSQVTVTATYPYSIDLLGITVRSGTLTSTTKERIE